MHPFNKTWIFMFFIYLWNTLYRWETKAEEKGSKMLFASFSPFFAVWNQMKFRNVYCYECLSTSSSSIYEYDRNTII